MQFGRLRRCLVHEISSIASGNGFQSSKLYSSNTMPRPGSMAPSQHSTAELYRRLTSVDNSISPVLDQWIQQGNSLRPDTLRSTIKKLRQLKRFHHALEISMWMAEKSCYDLTSADVALRVQLISKAQGVEQAEEYFGSVPQELKGLDVYGALHKCYANAQCVEKAEALMQEMRDLRFPMVTEDYNIMLMLYYKTGKMEKFNALLDEMEANGIVSDRFTLGIRLSAYAAVMDIEGMDKMVRMIESNPKDVPNFEDYSVAATAYRKAGLSDKAFEMLKKAEACCKLGADAYNHLMRHYANMGMKDEVLSVWSQYKKKYKVKNKGYSFVLNCLVNLGDFVTAEKIIDEWESRDDLTYDMNIPDIVIGGYSRNGRMEKAEAFIIRAVSKGGKPNAWTWYHLVEGYFQNEQPQKAVEMMKKTILLHSGMKWDPVPKVATLKVCMEYLKSVGDTEQSKELVQLLVDKDIISKDKLEEALIVDNDERLSQGLI